ncbi:hypothetical protein CIG75_03960 [Tumebacillus algifaecis]|uniref:HTH araC/xylS-type domain-containing protein n=1 Tax=Tumebacillus algifaecis TaxID=1214604 RepID=A0A223CY30_9BACL|nr:Ada metal-binding domain-containing protein [Tumebacillus algifaecis]ASS74221.1 hypothetical protein CIG75_03960 [Tumebacillus algifaecis]
MDNTQWKAIFSCDSRYDGKFFYALSSTGTFCKPSCSSRTPNPKNVRIFYNEEAARSSGFRPCQRCRPDHADWEGLKRELFVKTKKYILHHYDQKLTLKDIGDALEKNPYYIQRTFKEMMGISPLQFLHDVRIEKSKGLLKEGHLSTTQISFDVGFSSLSHFSKVFKEKTGMTPKRYREVN